MDNNHLQIALDVMIHIDLPPHVGSTTREIRNKMAFVAARNLVDAFEGKEHEFAVNRDEIREARVHKAVRPMIVSVRLI